MELISNGADLENATVYGYPVKDLVLFAYACREMNVSELDLKEVVQNVAFAFNFVNREQEKMLKRALDETNFDVKAWEREI